MEFLPGFFAFLVSCYVDEACPTQPSYIKINSSWIAEMTLSTISQRRDDHLAAGYKESGHYHVQPDPTGSLPV